MNTRQLTIQIPEIILLIEKTDEVALAAVKLYELGRLSSGRAAELAGLSRVEFLLTLSRYKVFPLAAELQELERTVFESSVSGNYQKQFQLGG